MKNMRFILILLLLTSCNNTSLSSSKKNQEANEVFTKNSNIEVSTTIVTKQPFNIQIVSNGIVEARDRGELRFKTNEQINKIYVENGQKVSKGTLIANLDNQLLKNQLEATEIELSNAKLRFREEKINFGLGKKVIDSIPKNILKTLYQLSGYKEAQNRLEKATILYEQTLLKAPFSGTIANLTLKEGSYYSSTEKFCTLLSYHNLNVIFHIMEGDLSQVTKGQNIQIVPFAFKNTIYKGQIFEINPMVGEDGLVRVKANIENPGSNIFDGMNVKIFINKQIEDVVVVPKEALVMRSNREVVFTVQNNQAQWNYVYVAHENSTQYALSEGIQTGDTIIISNNMNLGHDADISATFVELEK